MDLIALLARRLALVALLLGWHGAGVVASAQTVRPNILVVMTDDQDQASVARMPRVTALLTRQGTSFSQSVVNFSLCCPSRATFLTGQHANNHGVLGNDAPNGGYARLNHDNTLAVWLRRAGYVTAHVGKYLNRYGEQVPKTTVPPGWTEWRTLIDPSTYRFFGFEMNENGRVVRYGTSPEDYSTDVITRKALEFLRASSSGREPFFLWVSYLAPHFEAGQGRRTRPAPRHRGAFAREPLPQPPSFNEADYADKPAFLQRRRLGAAQVAMLAAEHRLRLESLLAVDEGVEALVRELEASGSLDRTYVFYLSDNGYFQGQHRVIGGKDSYYEPSVRVPLIVRGPGVPRNVRRAQLVSNVDLAPTIVELAGAQPGLTMDGRSLVPLIQGGAASWRTGVYLTGRTRPPAGDGTDWPFFDGIRTPRYTYVEHRNGARELYDLRLDPFELDNRAAATGYAVVREDLAAKLATLKRCSGDTCWVTGPDAVPD